MLENPEPFIHAPLLTRDDDRCYFPGLCGVSETTMGHSRQASATTFPHVSLFTTVMIVLRRSLYGVVSEGRVLGLFVALPPAVLTGFPQEQAFRWKRVLAELSFSVLCSSCFTHGT